MMGGVGWRGRGVGGSVGRGVAWSEGPGATSLGPPFLNRPPPQLSSDKDDVLKQALFMLRGLRGGWAYGAALRLPEPVCGLLALPVRVEAEYMRLTPDLRTCVACPCHGVPVHDAGATGGASSFLLCWGVRLGARGRASTHTVTHTFPLPPLPSHTRAPPLP